MIHNVRRDAGIMLKRESRHEFYETKDQKDRIVKDLQIISKILANLKENGGIPEPSNFYNIVHALHSPDALLHPHLIFEYHLFFWLTTSLKDPYIGSSLGKFYS